MINENWVESSLSGMTLDEKVGQVLCPRVFGFFRNEHDPEFQKYMSWICKYHVGCVEIFPSTAYGAAFLLNQLQEMSKIPLLVTSDAESGIAHRISGATHLTHNMGLGATGDEEMAYLQGKITALEGRALGIHLFEGPTVDVNVNPENPIIGVRSFGDDPVFVARMGRAFIRGLQDHGMIGCAKHFPGHGNTDVDSHMEMPVLNQSVEELERIDLYPFREAIAENVMGIMPAHINVPALDSEKCYPATVSHKILTGLLREKMGFDGIIISDDMRMDGMAGYYPPGEAELQAFLAGNDIILGPFLEQTYETMRDALDSGRLSEEQLDRSIRRILRAKSWCGLHENKLTEPDTLHKRLATPEIVDDARLLTRKSITLLKNKNNLLPVKIAEEKKILGILYYDHDLGNIGETFLEEIRKRAVEVDPNFHRIGVPNETGNIQTVTLRYNGDKRFEEEALEKARDYDLVICGLVYRIIMKRGTPNLSPEGEAFMRRVTSLDVPVAAVSFCVPYIIKQFPDVDAFVCSYMYSPLVQKAAVEALFGEIPFQGKLPLKRIEGLD